MSSSKFIEIWLDSFRVLCIVLFFCIFVFLPWFVFCLYSFISVHWNFAEQSQHQCFIQVNHKGLVEVREAVVACSTSMTSCASTGIGSNVTLHKSTAFACYSHAWIASILYKCLHKSAAFSPNGPSNSWIDSILYKHLLSLYQHCYSIPHATLPKSPLHSLIMVFFRDQWVQF